MSPVIGVALGSADRFHRCRTIEEKIMNMQDSKKTIASELIKTDESVFKALTKDDLLGLL